ncbi:MAG TPA: PilZ domain-containing protein [Vicinamibacteria bacterium]|nr:PilZ domain-containing protein [Vicinamibacteria bacterium]
MGDPPEGPERRSAGLLRVPFVQRCRLDLGDGQSRSPFLVNISVLGAYVAEDEQPSLGKRGVCVFRLPGNAFDVTVSVVVAWVNPRQQHPIHSLPPGYGLRFLELTEAQQARIQNFVREYAGRVGKAGIEPGS